jgi:hypothetical protein
MRSYRHSSRPAIDKWLSADSVGIAAAVKPMFTGKRQQRR